MQKIKISLSPPSVKKDLKIIFKDENTHLHEIQVSKREFLNTFRYFQGQINEINQTNLVYIEENVSFDIFSAFLASMSSHEIEIDQQNYEQFYHLSSKYEFEELREKIAEFIKERPDLNQIIEDLTKRENNDKKLYDQISIEKEEIISKNLDICIQNGNLQKLPLNILNRILNSPSRVVKNHHLLFSFIFEIIKKKMNENLNESEIENLSVLPSALDYLEMSNSEIIELLSIEKNHSNFFINPKNSEEKMRKMIENENDIMKKYESIENKMMKIESAYNDRISNLEKLLNDSQTKIHQLIEYKNKNDGENEAILNRIGQLEEYKKSSSEKIQSYEDKISKLEKSLGDSQAKIDQLIKNEEKEKETKLDILKRLEELEKNNKKLVEQNQIVGEECQDGIFQYLFNKYNRNPIDQGIVDINATSFPNFEMKLPKIIEPKWAGSYWVSTDVDNSSVTITFKNSLVKISKYRLRVGDESGSYIFNSWTLKGITQDNQEIILDNVNNSSKITRKNPETTISIQNNNYFKSIQLIKRGKGSDDHYWMVLRNIELFGGGSVNDIFS